MKLTTRSKIAVRTTTSPSDMGYGGEGTNWRNGAADIITSPAKALEYVAGLRSKFGGADFLVELRHGDRVVTKDDLSDAIYAAEARRQ